MGSAHANIGAQIALLEGEVGFIGIEPIVILEPVEDQRNALVVLVVTSSPKY